MDLEVVDQARLQVLLGGARPAGDRDVLAAGCRLRLLERRLDAVGDERERRLALDQRLARMVGEDEDGLVEGRLVAPPALPRLIAPRRVVPRALAAEHSAAHDVRADVARGLFDDLRVDVVLARGPAVFLVPGRRGEGPVMKLLAAFSQALVGSHVRPGDEPVEGHRDVEGHSCHRSSCRWSRAWDRRGRPRLIADAVAEQVGHDHLGVLVTCCQV